MRTRIKVCCIASPDEARIAIAAGADALGLVARLPSGPGPISDRAIAEVMALVPPPVATFLLTSETTADAISAHVRATAPSAVQIVSHIHPAESGKLAALELSIGVQKGPPIGVQKGPPSSSSVTGMGVAPFALVAA